MRPLLLAIALASFSGCIDGEEREGSQPSPEPSAPLETQQLDSVLLEIAGQEAAVASFIAENPGYSYEVTVLTPENLTELSEKYPVVYGNLPRKTLYRVEYRNGEGLLVIVDLEDKEVLRYFRTVGVSLG